MLNGLEGIDLTAPDALDKINALAKGLSDKNADLLGKISSGKEQSTASAAELENLRLFKQGADQKIPEEGQQYEQAKPKQVRPSVSRKTIAVETVTVELIHLLVSH